MLYKNIHSHKNIYFDKSNYTHGLTVQGSCTHRWRNKNIIFARESLPNHLSPLPQQP